MDKPEEKKPTPPGGLPRPPIGGKKPDGLSKGPMGSVPTGPVPPRPAGQVPKLPLPGQKPGLPARPMPPMGSGIPGRPAAPLAPIQPPLNPAVEKNLSDAESSKNNLQEKITELEKRLMEEREKVLLSSLRSKEEEAVSAKVETSIKEIQDKLRREKRDQETDEARRKAEARALEMERRLAEEREAWVQTLKNQLNQRDQITQEMETHFSSRLKDLEYRWSQEKSSLESALKEREAEVLRIRQEVGLKSEQERGFWEDRLRTTTMEKEKIERELERTRDKAQQEKDQLIAERQNLRDNAARLESSVRMLEDQHRIERTNLTRESEGLVGNLKQQLIMIRDQSEKQISSLNLQLQSQSKELIEKIGQIEAIKSQLSGLNVQMEQANARLADRDRAVDSLKNKLQDTEVEKQRIEAAWNHSNAQKKEAEAMLEEVRTVLRSKELALDEARRLRMGVEEESKAKTKTFEDDVKKLQDEVVVVRQQARQEIHKIQQDNDERIRSLHARLEPYEVNSMKIYNEARDKVRVEIAALEKQLREATRKIEQMSDVDSDRAQLVGERDILKTQLEQIRTEWKESQWALESQIKSLQDELRGEKIKVQQVEESKLAVEQEIKQRMENRAFDQNLLEEREAEIERLTKNFETLVKAFESQKNKIPLLNKEIEDLKKMVHEKGLQTNEELRSQMEEKSREVERLHQNLRSLKENSQSVDQAESLFKEKERVFRQLVEDKEATITEFKSRVHSLERRLDEFDGEREGLKADAKKEMEKLIQAKNNEMGERLEQQKDELVQAYQQEIEKAKFQSAKETAERIRAEMPSISENPELIRQEVERDMATQLQEKESALEAKLKQAKEDAKKDVDKAKWESESAKEELKRAREARNQIEKEAQELLQQAEDHYRAQLDKKLSEIKGQAVKNKGLFSAIGKILDTPIIDFNKKKDEDF